MIAEMRKILKTTDCTIKFIMLLLLRCPFDAAFTVINAVFLQNAFNSLTRNDATSLSTACFGFGVANLCLFLYNGTVWSVYAAFVVRMEGRLRKKLYQKISSLSCQKIEDAPPGNWLTLLNADVRMPFSRPLHFPHAVCAITNISVSAVILWIMNPAAFGWIMVFVIPHILVSQFLIAKAMPELNKKCLEAAAANASEVTSLITCADVAVLYDAHDFLMKRFKKSSLNLLRANMDVRAKNALSAAILPLFGLSGYLTLLIVAGGWIANGELTFGDLTAAFQYRGGVLTGAIMLINSLIAISASMASIRRLNATMSEETE